jgi:hypothetical protein
MSLRVLCRDYPQRTIALAAEDYVLSFQHISTPSESFSTTSLSSATQQRCIVEFSSRSSINLKEYRPLSTCFGTLGLITLNSDVFLCVVARASQVATVRPGETVQRISNVEFCEISSSPNTRLCFFFSDSRRLPQQLELRQRAGL